MTNMPITLATVGTYDGVTVADGTLGRTPGQPGMEKVWCALRLMPRLDSQHFDGCRLGFAEDSWIKALETAKKHRKNMPKFQYIVLADYLKIENGCIQKSTNRLRIQEPKNP